VTGRSARLVVVVLALLVSACGSGDDASPASTSTTAASGTTGSTDTTASSAPSGDLEAVNLKLTEVAELEAPTTLTSRSGSTSLYVTEQIGRVREITVEVDEKTQETTYAVERTPVLDISRLVTAGGEQGLLGLAFSSDGRRLYVAYTGEGGSKDIVAEYTMATDKADTKTRRELLSVDDPYANHNGGDLHFGPDGFLYIAMGDGGSGGDPHGNAQNTSALLGKILRIDPEGRDGDLPYGIPDGNPFADGGGAPEVWLYGVRNPWRFSFDADTDDLWINDVGQDAWEEIDRLLADDGGGRGANLGWNGLEGTHGYKGGKNPAGAVLPIYEYSHDDGTCSITGGALYRGKAIPDLDGAYLFADYCAPSIRALQVDGAGKVTAVRNFDDGTKAISSFGTGPDGEVYVLALGGGISRLEPG
jgi:glucose/arabinose dehydrogenase